MYSFMKTAGEVHTFTPIYFRSLARAGVDINYSCVHMVEVEICMYVSRSVQKRVVTSFSEPKKM